MDKNERQKQLMEAAKKAQSKLQSLQKAQVDQRLTAGAILSFPHLTQRDVLWLVIFADPMSKHRLYVAPLDAYPHCGSTDVSLKHDLGPMTLRAQYGFWLDPVPVGFEVRGRVANDCLGEIFESMDQAKNEKRNASVEWDPDFRHWLHSGPAKAKEELLSVEKPKTEKRVFISIKNWMGQASVANGIWAAALLTMALVVLFMNLTKPVASSRDQTDPPAPPETAASGSIDETNDHALRGNVSIGRPDDRESLKFDNRLFESLLDRGIHYLNKQRPDLAKLDLEQARAMKQNERVLTFLSRAYLELGETEKAGDILRQQKELKQAEPEPNEASPEDKPRGPMGFYLDWIPGGKTELQPGDLLLRWEIASEGNEVQKLHGLFDTPFSVFSMRVEAEAHEKVIVYGRRDGFPLVLEMGREDWRFRWHPRLPGDLEAQFRDGLALFNDSNWKAGVQSWDGVVDALRQSGKSQLACWVLLETGNFLRSEKEWDLADRYYLRAIDLAEAMGDRSMAGWALNQRGGAFHRRYYFNEAKRDYAAALNELEKSGAGALIRTNIRMNMVSMDILLGKNDDAVMQLEPLLRLLEDIAPISDSISMVLHNLSLAEKNRGNLDISLDYAHRDLHISESLYPDQAPVMASYLTMGHAEKALKNLDAAEFFYRCSLDLARKLNTPDSVVEEVGSLDGLASVLKQRGNYLESEACYLQALAVLEEKDPDSRYFPSIFSNLGLLYYHRGSYSLAEVYLKQALEKYSPDSMGAARALTNLGLVYRSQGRVDEAEKELLASLKIKRAGGNALGIGSVLLDLGMVHYDNGAYRAAEELIDEALVIFRSNIPGGEEEAECLIGKGRVLEQKGDLQQAVRLLRQAIEFKKRVAPNSPGVADALYFLGLVQEKQGRYDEAMGSFEEGLNIIESHLETPALTKRANSDLIYSFEALFKALANRKVDTDVSQAFLYLERFRARVLLNMIAEREAELFHNLKEPLKSEYQKIEKEHAAALKALFEDREGETTSRRQALQKIRAKRDRFEHKVKQGFPNLEKLKPSGPLSIQEIVATLDEDQAILSYGIMEEHTLLFIIRKNQPPTALRLPVGAEKLKNAVEALLTQLPQTEADMKRFQEQADFYKEQWKLLSNNLFSNVIQPALPYLDGIDSILYLADGPLHSIPPGSLYGQWSHQDRSETGYLISRFEWNIASSASVFVQGLRAPERPVNNEEFLVAFGDPIYSTTSGVSDNSLRSLSKRGLSLTPLPHSRKEVQLISALFPGRSTQFMGELATKENVLAVQESALLLHIACHGFVDPYLPMESALALSGNKSKKAELLSAWEIIQMKLNADLVTLSACSAGGGKLLAGDGLQGLAFAFQVAGARTVVAPVWPVQDQKTALLMEQFYLGLRNRLPKSPALREAQSKLAEQGHHPFFWGAFQLVGDPGSLPW
ncbi:MAG: CHAT domain-containing protein [Acidobacteriota bacterium]|nr:CHAT domain-containing protein [Acidobacteriota bacterium]